MSMKRWKELDLRGRTKLLVFSMLPAVVIVVSAEFLTSGTIHRSWNVAEDPLTGVSAYRMRIGRFPWGRESVTPLNTLGYPDDEFVNILPKGQCTHVVFAGDSYVFGDGVDRSESFPHLVKVWSSQKNPGRCIRFFNLAERGTTIEQQGQHIRKTLDLLDPDIILLGQYQNDLTDLTKPGFLAYSVPDSIPGTRRWTMRDRLRAFRFSTVRYLAYHVFAFAIKRRIKWDVLEQWSLLEQPANQMTAEILKSLYTSLFKDLVDDLRAREIELGVMILPSKFDVMAGRSPEEEFFLSLAAEHNVPALGLLATLDSNRTPYPFLMYDGHASAYGNYLIARAVYHWLFESETEPFPLLRVSRSVAQQ